MKFDWFGPKAESNIEKHDGVSFEEATTAFDDPMQTVLVDDAHSDGEERFILLATSVRGRVLTISYTERGDVTRIISAREATRAEVREYESHFYNS
ncbi:MAG: BrnT family toxin [Blastocatellia bacterium]